ncbi:hypothetical protein GALMADRAFT_248699 [Galerina marginata CBS 339.88]|uniref:MYND-type domain-containing protein n=1 Tax=Galerina marginata (strain CBS 339.88) TaxID=685588 RepID=A0A067T7M2_GALM3|nr:hypothetical protein GALMADRAFT_248699 [Galerina marginata CBS 339.88]
MPKSDDPSASHWKGQSRILKLCHWCAKKQEPGQKPFQACARCKEVIYCSKECQVASWPLHKGPCKLSSDAKAATAGNLGASTAIANFKKWHSLHLGPLRHAAICALDLGHNPSALDNNVLFIEIGLKFGRKDLSANRRYEPVSGFTLTMKETREMLEKIGGKSVLDSLKDANEHMRKKGGLGVAAVILQAHDVVDFVKILLPSPAATKQVQEADDWGKDWLEKLRMAVEID